MEHRDRFCRFVAEHVRAASTAEVDDDLVRDMTEIEITTSMWARRHGKRLAANGARRAVDASVAVDGEAA